MANITLDADQVEALSTAFETIDVSGDGFIQLNELTRAFKEVGLKIEEYEVRQMIESYASNKSELSFLEFQELYAAERKKRDFSCSFANMVNEAAGIIELPGLSDTSQGIKHTVRVEEQVAFADWINTNLSQDKDLAHLLPVDKNGDTLYEKCQDGLILCKLINLAVPETIDERAVNKPSKTKFNAYTKRENCTLALNSAQSIGCSIVNIDADDLAKGKQHLLLGLTWQIIRIGLFSQIDLKHNPGLVCLLQEGETLADLQKLGPEAILLRWVNYHLAQAGQDRRIKNFTTDITDSFAYSHLLNQIAPADKNVSLRPLNESDHVERAECMLKEAEKLDCRRFVTARDVKNGVYKLNVAFVANLFNTYPALEPPSEDVIVDIPEETREEKTYRNWMNSLNVDPYVNYLYSDLQSGVVIFQLYDVIKPGIVDWKQVSRKFGKLRAMMDQISNCNYAVDLGKKLRFSLVGIQGKDIYDGNDKLTLALVWQLMRAYTLTVLAQCTRSGDALACDEEIVRWANERMSKAGKSSQIKSFQDKSISSARPVADLIDAIQPGLIDYSVLRDSPTEEDKLANAKYTISMARRLGAKVYALPEDIVEVKPKMVLTVFACLMARDYLPNMGAVENGAASPVQPLAEGD